MRNWKYKANNSATETIVAEEEEKVVLINKNTPEVGVQGNKIYFSIKVPFIKS